MKRMILAMGVAGLMMAGCSAMQSGQGEAKEGPEVKVAFEQLPAAVQATVQREAEGVSVATVDKQSEGGKTIYEADAVIGGTPYEIKVAEDGKLISKAIDTEATGGAEAKEGAGAKDKD